MRVRTKLRKPNGWPRYMEVRMLADGSDAYYWKPPSWARKRGCVLDSEPLGRDYGIAKKRCDEILNPHLDAWRTGRKHNRPFVPNLRWLIAEFVDDGKFTRVAEVSRRDYVLGMELIASYVLKDGTRLGDARLDRLTTSAVDRLYENLCVRADGSKRVTTANKAMRAMRRAWNVVSRKHPSIVPSTNPFAQMGLLKTGGRTPAATRPQLRKFVETADLLGHPSVGTAALVAFEFLLREVDILERFVWTDYRPAERPDCVRLRHGKTEETMILPLIDSDGTDLFPELTSRLDKLQRRGVHIVMRDHPDKGSGQYRPFKRYWFSELVRIIRKTASLPRNLTFASFRHGGLTEIGDARVDDQGMMALSAHRTRSMLSIYSKRTEDQRIQAARARLQHRLRRQG